MQAARWWFGLSSPADGVTMPWRSASGSLANATSKRPARSRSRAIAHGDEQSIRIVPSQSSGTKRKVGSTASLTISSSRRWRSAIACQYATLAPPSGSTPSRMPARRIASRSITDARSST